jgi:hypothetical protein
VLSVFGYNLFLRNRDNELEPTKRPAASATAGNNPTPDISGPIKTAGPGGEGMLDPDATPGGGGHGGSESNEPTEEPTPGPTEGPTPMSTPTEPAPTEAPTPTPTEPAPTEAPTPEPTPSEPAVPDSEIQS